VAQRLRQRRVRREVDLERAVLGRDEDEFVAEQVAPAGADDQLLVRNIVHPFRVGGDEERGGRPLLRLFCEGGAGGAGIGHPAVAGGFIGFGDVLQRILGAGGGEDEQIVGPRRRGGGKQHARQSCDGKSSR